MTFRQVEGLPGVTCQVLIDGVGIMGTTWNFLEPDKNVCINLPLNVTSKNPTKVLKGFRFYGSSKTIYVGNLFELNNFKVQLCLYKILDPKNNEDTFYLYYPIVNQFVTACLQACIDDLPNSSTSDMILQSPIPLIRNRKERKKNMDLMIMIPDFVRFGELFAHHLQNHAALREHGLPTGVRACFVGTIFGQATEQEYIMTHLKTKVMQRNISECCIHVAYDCSSPGKTVLFGRNNLIKRLGQPFDEYFPMCISGAGNFYFHPVLANTQEINTVTFVKMYSEYGKYISNSTDKPFRSPKIGQHILNILAEFSLSRSCARMKKLVHDSDVFLQHLEVAERLCNISETSTKKGRIEIIVSMTGEIFGDISPIYVADEFLISRQLLEEGCILAYPSSLFVLRLQSSITPCVRMVRKHLLDLKRYLLDTDTLDGEPTDVGTHVGDMQTKFKIFSFGIGDFMNVLAVEAVVCFFIYGNSIRDVGTKENEKAHDYQLCRDLNLTASHYKTTAVFLPSVCNANLIISEDHVKYTPSPRMNILKSLKLNLSEIVRLDEVYKFCKNVRTDVVDLEKLCSHFLTILCQASLGSRRSHFPKTPKGTYSCHSSQKYENIKCMTVTEFLKFVLCIDNHRICNGGMLYFISILRSEIDVTDMAYFLKSCVEYFENRMYSERSILIFAIPQQQKALAIFPIDANVPINRNFSLLYDGWRFIERTLSNESTALGLKYIAKFIQKTPSEAAHRLSIDDMFCGLSLLHDYGIWLPSLFIRDTGFVLRSLNALLHVILNASLAGDKSEYPTTPDGTCRYHSKFNGSTLYMTVTEFVKLIFGQYYNEIAHLGLQFFVNILLSEIRFELVNDFKHQCINFIQYRLYHKKSIMVFPIPKNNELLVIVPIGGTNDCEIQAHILKLGWEFVNHQATDSVGESLRALSRYCVENPDSSKFNDSLEELFLRFKLV